MGGVKLGGSTSRVLSNWVRITSAERSVRSMFSCAVRTACVLTCAQTKQRQKQQQHQSTNPEAVTRGALAVRSRETKAAPSERVGEEAHLDGAHGGVERGEAAVEGAEYGDDGVGDLLALLQRLPQQRRALRQALHLHRRHPLPGLRTHRETVSRRGGWIWRRRGSERGAVSPVWLRRADDKDRVGVGEQGGRTPRWRPEQARAAAGGASSSKHTQLHKKQLALALASEKRARRTERAAAAAAAGCLSVLLLSSLDRLAVEYSLLTDMVVPSLPVLYRRAQSFTFLLPSTTLRCFVYYFSKDFIRVVLLLRNDQHKK